MGVRHLLFFLSMDWNKDEQSISYRRCLLSWSFEEKLGGMFFFHVFDVCKIFSFQKLGVAEVVIKSEEQQHSWWAPQKGDQTIPNLRSRVRTWGIEGLVRVDLIYRCLFQKPFYLDPWNRWIRSVASSRAKELPLPADKVAPGTAFEPRSLGTSRAFGNRTLFEKNGIGHPSSTFGYVV